jgi:hypothetical protein
MRYEEEKPNFILFQLRTGQRVSWVPRA